MVGKLPTLFSLKFSIAIYVRDAGAAGVPTNGTSSRDALSARKNAAFASWVDCGKIRPNVCAIRRKMCVKRFYYANICAAKLSCITPIGTPLASSKSGIFFIDVFLFFFGNTFQKSGKEARARAHCDFTMSPPVAGRPHRSSTAASQIRFVRGGSNIRES
jgi:hypothetical protein